MSRVEGERIGTFTRLRRVHCFARVNRLNGVEATPGCAGGLRAGEASCHGGAGACHGAEGA